tara:strand:+ start:2663 stop:3394 length:732 start_codon:yes stop_codon:yes gene_type:complete
MIGKGVLKPSYTQRPAYFAGILGMIAAIAGSLLVMGFVGTEKPIKQRALEDLQRSLSQVLPAQLYDNDPSLDTLDQPTEDGAVNRFYRATLASAAVASAFEVEEGGYSGPIRLVMGVSSEGLILGVRVLSHSETPGLGDKIETAKDDWILSFNGLSLNNLADERWGVKKDGGDFDQFSGATITPRAVVKAVKKGLLLEQANRAALKQKDEALVPGLTGPEGPSQTQVTSPPQGSGQSQVTEMH